MLEKLIYGVIGLALGGIVAGYLCHKRGGGGGAHDARFGPIGLGGLTLLLIALSVVALLLVYHVGSATGVTDELQMSLVIVAAIVVFMSVLFLVAAGFSVMGLTDPRQALGLPEGSIRSVIALLLIMIFIIFGIHLFRVVANGVSDYRGIMSTPPAPASPGQRIIAQKVPSEKPGGEPAYEVWAINPVSEEARALAQQLITTVGTLVVAVSGFYFGSSTATGTGRKPESGGEAIDPPTIEKVSPPAGPRGQTVSLEIHGSAFHSPKVRLVQGSRAVDCELANASASLIRCNAKLDAAAPAGAWDVVVTNVNGKANTLKGGFTVT